MFSLFQQSMLFSIIHLVDLNRSQIIQIKSKYILYNIIFVIYRLYHFLYSLKKLEIILFYYYYLI